MQANVMAESTGRLLASRLWEMTDDPGMKDMLSYLTARDTMHQNQWRVVLEEAFEDHIPILGSFPQEEENQEFNYAFMSTHRDDREDPKMPWMQCESPDGKGEFSFTDQPGGGTADLEAVIEEMHNEVN